MAIGAILRGWALAQQGQAQEGIDTDHARARRAFQATGAEVITVVLSGASRRSTWDDRATRGRARGARRSTDARGHHWSTFVRSQRCIGSKANFSASSLPTMPLKRKPASIKLLPSPKTNRPNPWNYVLPPAWLASGSSKANPRKPMTSWHQSTTGSLRALTPRTCRTPRRCWRRWRNAAPAETLLLSSNVGILMLCCGETTGPTGGSHGPPRERKPYEAGCARGEC